MEPLISDIQLEFGFMLSGYSKFLKEKLFMNNDNFIFPSGNLF